MAEAVFFPEVNPNFKTEYYKLKKSKAISVTDRGGLLCCEMSRIPHCLDNWLLDDGQFLSLGAGRALPPSKYFLVLISVRG
jgi:hypothetical protein